MVVNSDGWKKRGRVVTFHHVGEDVEGFRVVLEGGLVVLILLSLVSQLSIVRYLVTVRGQITHLIRKY